MMRPGPDGGSGVSSGGDLLAAWIQRTGRRVGERGHSHVRFAFYGRVSTEDWQDPVTSRARQREQAAALAAGHGRIVAEFFDSGHSRILPWARRPQAAALVAALADPDRGWDAIVIREYERAFYGKSGALRESVRVDGAVVRALWRAAVDAGSGRPGRLSRRRSRADDAGAGPVVQAGDYPDPDPGPYCDGGPDPGAGPVPGWPAAVRVPARRRRAAPEQGARRVGPLRAPPRAGPGDRAGRAVDVRAATGRAQRRADHPSAERRRDPVPVRGRPAPHRRRVDATYRGRDPGQPPVHRPPDVEPAAHRLRPG